MLPFSSNLDAIEDTPDDSFPCAKPANPSHRVSEDAEATRLWFSHAAELLAVVSYQRAIDGLPWKKEIHEGMRCHMPFYARRCAERLRHGHVDPVLLGKADEILPAPLDLVGTETATAVVTEARLHLGRELVSVHEFYETVWLLAQAPAASKDVRTLGDKVFYSADPALLCE